jgi:hypothetical protein
MQWRWWKYWTINCLKRRVFWCVASNCLYKNFNDSSVSPPYYCAAIGNPIAPAFNNVSAMVTELDCTMSVIKTNNKKKRLAASKHIVRNQSVQYLSLHGGFHKGKLINIKPNPKEIRNVFEFFRLPSKISKTTQTNGWIAITSISVLNLKWPPASWQLLFLN